MSNAPYLQTPDGAAAFTGTAATTVFASPPDTLTDADVNDVLHVRSTGLLTFPTPGELVEMRVRFRINGTTVHDMLFGSIGGDDDPRDVTLEWWIILTAGDTARIEGDGVVTGAGGQGPNKADRNPITRAQACVLPALFDITVQLDDVAATYTPDDPVGFLHKVEPTLSSATSTAAVTGVKGSAESTYRTGNVNVTAANVGALALADRAAPLIEQLTTGPNTGKYPNRPATSGKYEFAGTDEPEDDISVSGADGPNDGDFWRRLV